MLPTTAEILLDLLTGGIDVGLTQSHINDLVELGAEITATNAQGNNPLHLAAYAQRLDLM